MATYYQNGKLIFKPLGYMVITVQMHACLQFVIGILKLARGIFCKLKMPWEAFLCVCWIIEWKNSIRNANTQEPGDIV